MDLDWLDHSEYPFKPYYMDIGGSKMHYIDQGKGETFLFIHGTPSWSFEFRELIKGLSHSKRCIAPDHIGFGLSSKPKKYEYTLDQHYNNLNEFIERLDLNNITMVLHDFGGPLGLRYAIENPHRIKRFILINTWMWSFDNDADFKKFKWFLKNPMLKFLYKYFNFSAKVLLPKSIKKRKSKDILDHYSSPFSKISERCGPIGFAKSLLNEQSFFDELWKNRNAVKQIETLLIWGMQDDLLKPKFIEKFEDTFENIKTVKFQKAGHFPHEEYPVEVYKHIFRKSNQKPFSYVS